MEEGWSKKGVSEIPGIVKTGESKPTEVVIFC